MDEMFFNFPISIQQNRCQASEFLQQGRARVDLSGRRQLTTEPVGLSATSCEFERNNSVLIAGKRGAKTMEAVGDDKLVAMSAAH